VKNIIVIFNKSIKQRRNTMTKNKNKAKNQQANKAPSNNKGNSQSMKTLQTTASDANPDPRI
jgi:hypothetical protein